MFYFLNLYSYREYSRKKTNVFNSFNSSHKKTKVEHFSLIYFKSFNTLILI